MYRSSSRSIISIITINIITEEDIWEKRDEQQRLQVHLTLHHWSVRTLRTKLWRWDLLPKMIQVNTPLFFFCTSFAVLYSQGFAGLSVACTLLLMYAGKVDKLFLSIVYCLVIQVFALSLRFWFDCLRSNPIECGRWFLNTNIATYEIRVQDSYAKVQAFT